MSEPVPYFSLKIYIGLHTGKARQKMIIGIREKLPKWYQNFAHRHLYEDKQRIRCDLKLFFYGKQNKDIDNLLKGIFDSLKGHVIWDDMDIKVLYVEVEEHHGMAGFEIHLTELPVVLEEVDKDALKKADAANKWIEKSKKRSEKQIAEWTKTQPVQANFGEPFDILDKQMPDAQSVDNSH